MSTTNIRFPQTPIIDQTGVLSLEWLRWFQSPQFLSIDIAAPLGVASGGTGLSSGTSGGILAFTASTTLASSAELINHRIVVGGGAGAVPYTIGAGTTTTVLHGSATGDPTYGAVVLTSDVSGILPVANGGTGRNTGTSAYALVATGTTATGVQQSLAVGATTELLVGGGSGALPVWTTATGTGAPVRANTPTLITPVLGVATATSINKVTITAPATSATLTIADGKTLTADRTLTFTGTDSTTMTFPTTNATIARNDAAQTFTGVQTFSSQPIMSTLTASQVVFTDGSKGLVSNAITGTGNVVMSASPTLTGTIGAANATFTGLVGIGAAATAALDVSVSTNGYYACSFVNTNAGGYGVRIRNGSDSNDAIRISNAADSANTIRLFGDGTSYFAGGMELGAPTGGNKGNGTLNVATEIYKNNSAYTNPDYVFEHAFTGKIEKFADKAGASEYAGLMSLEDTEAFARECFHLPGFGQDAGHGLFSGSDALLAHVEELYLHIFQLNKRLSALEAR